VRHQTVNNTVERIIDEVGTDSEGKPNSNIIVVSDHGFAVPFHSCCYQQLSAGGFDNTKVRAVTSGPAVNIYINLQGREPNGTVSPEYALQQQVTDALTEFVDTSRTIRRQCTHL